MHLIGEHARHTHYLSYPWRLLCLFGHAEAFFWHHLASQACYDRPVNKLCCYHGFAKCSYAPYGERYAR